MLDCGEATGRKIPTVCKIYHLQTCEMPINNTTLHNKRRRNTGRGKKMNSRDKRTLRTTLLTLRHNAGHFTPRRVHLESGLEHVSNPTIRRHMNKLEFYYLRTRKEGLLSVQDVKLRRRFCRKITRRRVGPKLWIHGISLYLDGTGFVYKKIPWTRPQLQQHMNGRGSTRDYKLVAQP